ncbi:peptide-methionine (R)-S-oxide reductase MsrB [Flagellimonas sediminis]|uniref:peptide-methionine (R)-S-oxide reductase n=1 Tax=Flagellimonas sediminis TaxID=2696468 RepID=A0A6I5L4C6_9FLAO|nr:peptide-methionine (R)-S-oxide reductase MsrB [Allomuricauda sediminis]NDV44908.1 peptide-methionine (R)-S-oxide reductase MsrB [Allomuricauda sediminis]
MGKRLLLMVLVIFIGCKGTSQEEKKENKKETAFKVNKTDAEWRAELTDAQYYVLRKEATENAFSSNLLKIKTKGTYVCAGCGTPVFRSEYKFDSGTGWPSFDREIEGNVAYDVDYKIGVARTEEHCAVCGGHLGHVFNDGPRETTGKRHCINGVALNFIPDGKN